MERNSATTEEAAIFAAIEEELPWDRLSKRLKMYVGGQNEWNAKIKDYCIRKRYRWSECHAKNACREIEYYEDLIRYTRKSLALFPYHLADLICRVLRVTPFKYYCDVLFEVIRSERSYDSIPNFAAADALRITGIGRNEFIDIMNKCRGKKLMWKLNKAIAKEYLPELPRDFEVQPWWQVSVVNLSLEEYRKLTPEEVTLVDRVAKDHNNMVAEVDLDLVRALYKRGLVYFDVPVYSDDRFLISSLEGFVSNRDQSYEDPMEELLYNVFVASSERATVAELASTLQSSTKRLEAAVSIACRLGFAKKILDPSYLFGKNAVELTEEDPDGQLTEDSDGEENESRETVADEPEVSDTSGKAPLNRFALMVDANLTSYLMMGSLSPGLKRHAVTLFEAGKLNDANVAEIVDDLQSVEGTRLEGELQRFADHAFSLRIVLQTLRSGGLSAPDVQTSASPPTTVRRASQAMADLLSLEGERRSSGGGSPTEDVQKIHTGVPNVAKPNEAVSDGDENGAGKEGLEASSIEKEAPTTVEGGSIPSMAEGDAGKQETASTLALTTEDDDWKDFQAADNSSPVPGPAADKLALDVNLSPEGARPLTPNSLQQGAEREGGLLVSTPRGDGGQDSQQSTPRAGTPRSPRFLKEKTSKRLRFYVDVLRSESLASLQSSIVQQILKRDYGVLVSMVPLSSPHLLASPDGSGPVHFGPPSSAACTPWMKLLLYSVAQAGPETFALVRGQRLRVLPPELRKCPKASVWAWDGVGVGGVGGHGGEGSVVEGGLLLHALNILLKFSAVLVQPLDSGEVSMVDVPLPLPKEHVGDLLTSDAALLTSDADPFLKLHKELALRKVVHELHLSTLGYIRMTRVTPLLTQSLQAGSQWVPQSVEFGVPLFDTSLCKRVCEGAVTGRLFDPAALERHRAAMQALRMQLRDFIGDYKANGRLANEFFASRKGTSVPGSDGDSLPPNSSNRPLEKRASLRANEEDFNELPLPGVNLYFDGTSLRPVDLGTCLQGRLPAALIAEATGYAAAELSRRVSLAA